MTWKFLAGLGLGVAAFAFSFGADLPDLAQLKIAAETGDRVAEYEYGRRVAFSNPKEQFDLYLKSAQQGYGPAQDAVAEILHARYIPDAKKKKATEREAARWASRAAYQGIVSAQARLGSYYDRGVGVTKDPVKAYMWMEIAVRNSSAPPHFVEHSIYKVNRDALIKQTSTDDILKGQQMAAAFRAEDYLGMTPVEADLIFADLKLTAIYQIKNYQSAVVNNVRINVGETKALRIDDQTISLTCLAIEGKSVRLAISRTSFQTTLNLEH
ncbi:MAG TPA: tetratricopeptide repeat protein [Candidatus Limnocylindria bacterium]|jgi:hypothetical protein|nr:tetratricopeptide repeat protein [Candidatus Limnocylindria bacterium]HTL69284.1 tetratricopeptide repeat protein [Lacunisphaera sp.]